MAGRPGRGRPRSPAGRGRSGAARFAGRLDPDNFSHRFSALCKRAGLGHWHPHELRHSGASLMLAHGRSKRDSGGHERAPDRAVSAGRGLPLALCARRDSNP
ncbi:tyrosine-type recombinase/integrase [Micromonospora sp. NPDC051006]|uniref:tyrosine-type recombinase/integrase n=1 Tax=Micromonospora sp. NPDC051006 TaxID=3364283 RepID=UPI0037ACED11